MLAGHIYGGLFWTSVANLGVLGAGQDYARAHLKGSGLSAL